MTSRSPTSIDDMLSWIPVPVRAALEAEFHLQVKSAYTKHLNDELVAVQATVPQAALPSLPQILTEVTPAKAEKPVTETSGSNQGKRKASSDAPPCPQENSTSPLASFANSHSRPMHPRLLQSQLLQPQLLQPQLLRLQLLRLRLLRLQLQECP
jgi:hypothetical protein